MGEIGAEELMNWEKQQNMGNGTEEKILVLVRLRPLSEKETAQSEVVDWECINSSTILYRNSLQERSGLPTAYSFDRVFRGDCSTREVYEEGAKDIALSVVGGINSTIFAYGQTSSGKTYTMNGITVFAVADIYEYIQRHEERAFTLKFSAMEIYNEVVRDLLSTDNTPLRLLDDLERGTIVERLTEEILRDRNHLEQLLSICEAQRKIGETSLNETSSRSHQILRLTIESSAREFLGKGNSTTLAASVNFVDLAGSERAFHALSGGQRLKEGCHINRSLLTLGTVIRKLSKEPHGHVNYRDSKLTRILQPALGGNARTAIICTLSPARSHIEQSRNTLLFASCAKEVSTNAQVNVVMSDKALVKHLQKEVARLENELRTPGSKCDHAALLRKKDVQIEKLEKEVNKLTKQLNLTDSRIEDLMQSAEIDKNVQKLNEIQFVNGEVTCNGSSDLLFSENTELRYSSNDVSDKNQGTDESPIGIEADRVDIYKEVRGIDNGCPYDILDKKTSISSKLRRTKSCRANFTTSSSDFEMAEQGGNTPSTVLEKNFIGRPEGGFLRKHWKLPPLIDSANSARLTRNDSRSSYCSSFIDETRSQNCTNGDEDIPTLGSFVAGLGELAKLQVQDTGARGEKNASDVALEAMRNWPLKFEKLQKSIIELWQVCNVPLVHRTHFILLVKNDFTDSIYIEVEYRRLSFLKDTFSRGNSAVQDGCTLTLASSKKALRREREMLSRLMHKRYTEEERNRIYEEWGVSVNSKRRRLQLVHLLWSDTQDMVHVTKSAAIVAKLIGFSEHGLALKEMFGLSFTPPRMSRRSFGWKNSVSSLF